MESFPWHSAWCEQPSVSLTNSPGKQLSEGWPRTASGVIVGICIDIVGIWMPGATRTMFSNVEFFRFMATGFPAGRTGAVLGVEPRRPAKKKDAML